MTFIDITHTPLGYLQTHADEIEAAFAAGMSAQQLFKALNASDAPPPMSYRNFCRLTNAQRKPPQSEPAPNKARLSSVKNKPKTASSDASKSFKIKTFEHKPK